MEVYGSGSRPPLNQLAQIKMVTGLLRSEEDYSLLQVPALVMHYVINRIIGNSNRTCRKAVPLREPSGAYELGQAIDGRPG